MPPRLQHRRRRLRTLARGSLRASRPALAQIGAADHGLGRHHPSQRRADVPHLEGPSREPLSGRRGRSIAQAGRPRRRRLAARGIPQSAVAKVLRAPARTTDGRRFRRGPRPELAARRLDETDAPQGRRLASGLRPCLAERGGELRLVGGVRDCRGCALDPASGETGCDGGGQARPARGQRLAGRQDRPCAGAQGEGDRHDRRRRRV